MQGAAGATTIYLLNDADTSTSPYANPSTIMSVPELFAGRMGCYGMGRNWFSSVDGKQYFAGDIVGGGSGTSAYNYRDAVLKMTENNFLANGGAFNLPGTGDVITAMIFPPVLDTSLGVGSLQIFTAFSVFANNAPADRTTWANLTWPIQTESLKDQGAVAQDSTVIVNSDAFFRSDFNYCSLVLARRQFQLNQWGNKPVADEMQRVLQMDNQSLLPYGSGVSFDNRLLMACGPIQAGTGVYHPGLISLNFDPLSSLRVSDPAIWEGVFEGVNILKIVTGRVNGLRRCFAFTLNQITSQLELYELLAESVAIQNNNTSDNDATPIGWMFETAAMFNSDVHQLTELLELRDGEIYLSDLAGTARVQVYYRPDFYECWTLWNSFTVCSTEMGSSPSYRMRVGLGEPDVRPVEVGNNRPLRQGYFFQFRFVITGYCTINGFRASATTVAQPVFAPVGATPVCDTVECETVPDLQIYSLQSPPWQPPSAGPNEKAFSNQAVTFSIANLCASANPPKAPCLQNGLALPSWISFTGGATTVDTSGIAYSGSPSIVTLSVIVGQAYFIIPGANEQGVTLKNGFQTVTLVTGVPVTVIAQTAQLLFSNPSIIPAGTNYADDFYALTGLNPAISYNFYWGLNEYGASWEPDGFHVSPGAGQVTVINGVSEIAIAGNGLIPVIPVTARVSPITGVTFTGTVQTGSGLGAFIFTGAAGTFFGATQQAANANAQFALNSFIINNFNAGNIGCC